LAPTFIGFLQNSSWHMMLFAVTIISGGLLVWSFISRLFTGQAPKVGTAEAVQLINRRDALVIDLRAASEFAGGHIANARHIPASELETRSSELEKFKERPIILSCQFGNQSLVACAKLKKRGFEAYTLNGGIGAWQQAGLPLEK
jgi:rhodanese-related sulfurtransferase